MKELYERIYNTTSYGDIKGGRCPAIDYLPSYLKFMQGKIVDWGCGRGLAVERFREMGFEAIGVDQVDLANNMLISDITEPLKIKHDTAICIDVLEHIINAEGVLKNLSQANRAVISVHNGSSKHRGIELHINRKSFKEWAKLIRKYFTIKERIPVHRFTMLYLCEKNG